MKVLVYLGGGNSQDEQVYYNAVRIFHACCKSENFRSIVIEKHGFSLKSFDTYT